MHYHRKASHQTTGYCRRAPANTASVGMAATGAASISALSADNTIAGKTVARPRFTCRPLRLVITSVSLSISAALALALPAYAVDAGLLNRQLQQQRPNITSPSDPHLILPDQHGDQPAGQAASQNQTTVTVRKIQFQGLEGGTISDERAQQAVASYLNRPLTFDQLRQIINTITELCRQNDMPLAQAILPPQTINEDGVLRIQVIAGHYDNAIITNNSSLHDSIARNILTVWTKPGELVRRSNLQHAALLLSEIPGVHSQVLLEPGNLQGTSAANVHIDPASRYLGYLSMDNQGDPTTGRGRIVAGGYINQLLGIGDQLQFTLLDAFEKSGLINASVDYSALINGYGTRAGFNYSYLHYHYNLTDVSFSGYSNNWNLYLNQPWLRRPGARTDLRLDGGQQFLHDRIAVNGNKQVSTASLALQGSFASTPGGITAFSLRGTAGSVSAVNPDITNSNRFLRLSYYLSHQQHIWQPLSFFVSVKGQLPNQNLDTSQKLILGGADSVRAYDTGNGVADNGTILTTELRSRWNLPFSVAGGQPELTFAAFYDQGWGQQYRHNERTGGGRLVNSDNRMNLSGAGLYLSLVQTGNYSVTLTWAHRTGEPDPSSGYRGRDRLWISAIKTF